jgi:hypothetical protein
MEYTTKKRAPEKKVRRGRQHRPGRREVKIGGETKGVGGR